MSNSPASLIVVDDEETFRYATCRLLREAGFTVFEASDYKQATRLLTAQPVDLMLVDIVLPTRVNGFALARIAKMLHHDLRLLYITAYAVPASRGMGKILRKPIDDAELVREIRQALAA